MVLVDISPAAAVRRLARVCGSRTAVEYEGTAFGYAQVDDDGARLAAGLAESGVRRGDRVAYLGLNSITLIRALLAAWRLGAVLVPLNSRLAPEELANVLRDAEPGTLIVEEGHRPVAAAVPQAAPGCARVLADDDPLCPAPGAVPEGWLPLSALANATAPHPAPVPLHEDDIAVLMYTSGSSGRPKGVILTHGNLWWSARAAESMLGPGPDEVNLAIAPMFHIGGLNALTLPALLRGGTVVLRRRFDPERTLEDLRHHRVTSFFAVPAMYAALARAPRFADVPLDALRVPLVAGAPVPERLLAAYAAREVRLLESWGMTETSPFATCLPPSLAATKPGSAGPAAPYVELCLKDPATGTVVADPDTEGEICVRGPSVTPGYWNDATATHAAFDAGGWLHSGDVGRCDTQGFLYVVGRLKDLIITGGENVHPAEVESALLRLPGIVEAAVIGVPDPVWGETAVAFVTCEPGAAPTTQEMRRRAGRFLARYKLPTRLITLPELPRTASGKVAKEVLRAEHTRT